MIGFGDKKIPPKIAYELQFYNVRHPDNKVAEINVFGRVDGQLEALKIVLKE